MFEVRAADLRRATLNSARFLTGVDQKYHIVSLEHEHVRVPKLS